MVDGSHNIQKIISPGRSTVEPSPVLNSSIETYQLKHLLSSEEKKALRLRGIDRRIFYLHRDIPTEALLSSEDKKALRLRGINRRILISRVIYTNLGG